MPLTCLGSCLPLAPNSVPTTTGQPSELHNVENSLFMSVVSCSKPTNYGVVWKKSMFSSGKKNKYNVYNHRQGDLSRASSLYLD